MLNENTEKVIDFTLEQTIPLQFYKMNNLAISRENSLLFITGETDIHVFYINFHLMKIVKTNITLKCPSTSDINKTALKKYQKTEYLICVDGDDKAFIFNISDLELESMFDKITISPNLILKNNFSLSTPPFSFEKNTETKCPDLQNMNDINEFNVDQGTWSFDLNPKFPYIAFGSNSHFIHSFHLKTREKGVFWKLGHNVPNVAFSPCGKFLACVSIAKTVGIRRFYGDCGLIVEKKLSKWMWTVNWIVKKNIRKIIGTKNVKNEGYEGFSSKTYSEMVEKNKMEEEKSEKNFEFDNELENYLIIASDAHNVYLYKIFKLDDGDKYSLRVLSSLDISSYVQTQFRHSKDVFRFSIDKKLKEREILTLGLHHSNIILLVEVVQLGVTGDYILKSEELRIFPDQQTRHCMFFTQNLVGLDIVLKQTENCKYGDFYVFAVTVQGRVLVYRYKEEDLLNNFSENLGCFDKNEDLLIE